MCGESGISCKICCVVLLGSNFAFPRTHTPAWFDVGQLREPSQLVALCRDSIFYRSQQVL